MAKRKSRISNRKVKRRRGSKIRSLSSRKSRRSRIRKTKKIRKTRKNKTRRKNLRLKGGSTFEGHFREVAPALVKVALNINKLRSEEHIGGKEVILFPKSLLDGYLKLMMTKNKDIFYGKKATDVTKIMTEVLSHDFSTYEEDGEEEIYVPSEDLETALADVDFTSLGQLAQSDL